MTNTPNIISREEAKSLGLKRFFTGIACKKGHLSEFYVSDKRCVDCTNHYDVARGAKTKLSRGKMILQEDGSYIGWPCIKCGNTKRNKNKVCIVCRKRRAKKHIKTRCEKLSNLRKIDPLPFREKEREYYKRATHVFRAGEAAHRALKIKAKPKWLSKDQVEEINFFYKNRKKGYQVDHIVPLNSDVVCGLHVAWNLQHLTKSENQQKRNKFPTCEKSMRPACFDPPEE